MLRADDLAGLLARITAIDGCAAAMYVTTSAPRLCVAMAHATWSRHSALRSLMTPDGRVLARSLRSPLPTWLHSGADAADGVARTDLIAALAARALRCVSVTGRLWRGAHGEGAELRSRRVTAYNGRLRVALVVRTISRASL